MGIFNFNRQNLHTQMTGSTTGREMFKIDEYNQVKKKSAILGTILFGILTMFYFWGNQIPMKVNVFLGIIAIGCGVWIYYNIKHQQRVRRSLY